jgi:hypothetical protein
MSMPLAGFERAIPATKRPQIYALERAATGTGVSATCSTHLILLDLLTLQIFLTSIK